MSAYRYIPDPVQRAAERVLLTQSGRLPIHHPPRRAAAADDPGAVSPAKRDVVQFDRQLLKDRVTEPVGIILKIVEHPVILLGGQGYALQQQDLATIGQ